MDQSRHTRVYINPNFKRPELDPWSTEPIKTTHFNRHYLEEMPNKVTNTNINHVISNNRKIYVNPNFMSCNNATHSKPLHAGYVKTIENINDFQNKQVFHKSKYSLVQNFQQAVVNKEKAITEIYKNNIYTTVPVSYQNTTKRTQGVPLARSRYSIIRKKRLSINAGNISVNNVATDNKYPVQSSPLNHSSTNLHAVKNIVMNKLNNNIPERITKIKITKYKMVPVSDLKKNAAAGTNKNKFVVTPLKSYSKNKTRLSPSLITSNKNRFKFIKTSTPVPSLKVASRITQHKEKGMCSGNKVKKSRLATTNFNINNIPCRLFKKYGKCLRQTQGHCKYLHDKKHVSLCRKFLKGICHDKNCTLSHELTDKKMPTCYFYLKRMCTKESCPYLHVKLSDKTKICQEFLKGYCESGDKCLFRHFNTDELKKTKVALNSQRNTLKKVIKPKLVKIERKSTKSCDQIKTSEEMIGQDDENCRYYKESVNSDDSYETIKPTRCKLGTLPSFIQL